MGATRAQLGLTLCAVQVASIIEAASQQQAFLSLEAKGTLVADLLPR